MGVVVYPGVGVGGDGGGLWLVSLIGVRYVMCVSLPRGLCEWVWVW